MAALLGYTRVSTGEQEFALQHDALTGAGCLRVFSDTASGSLDERVELARLLDHLRAGDTLGRVALGPVGRSLRHLVDAVTALAGRDVGFRSLQESIDTTAPGGRLVFHVFAALAEFERDLIRERTQAGLAAARARVGGRPSTMTAEKLEVARAMYASGGAHRRRDRRHRRRLTRDDLPPPQPARRTSHFTSDHHSRAAGRA